MSGPQRLTIILFAATVFLFLVGFLGYSTGQPQEQVLFWSVAPSQAASITEKLKELGVEYHYRNKDGAITVSSGAQMGQIMMSLASDGLLPEDLSYDFSRLIKDTGFSLTKDERDRNYYIALDNEIAKMLQTLDFVTDVKVHISLEEESPLLKRHIDRTASVQLGVKGKRRLKKSEVEGVARLVASAVKGLQPSKVSITDTQGRPYTFSDELDATDKFQMKEELEQRFKLKIEEYLEQWIPKVVSTVWVDLDLQKHRKEIKDYAHKDLNKGELGVVLRSESEKETSTSKEGSQGVTGAGTNTSAEIKEGDGGTQMDMAKSRKMDEFDNNLVQEFITYDQGTVYVRTIAVTVVDKKYNPEFNPNLPRDEKNMEYIPYDWKKEGLDNQNPKIETMVANIMGVPESLVKVTQQSMMLDISPTSPSGFTQFLRAISWPLVTMVVLAMIAAFMLLRMVKKAQPEEDILPMPEYAEDVKTELAPLEESDKDPRIVQVEKRIKEIIDEDPAKAASLIKHWMSND